MPARSCTCSTTEPPLSILCLLPRAKRWACNSAVSTPLFRLFLPSPSFLCTHYSVVHYLLLCLSDLCPEVLVEAAQLGHSVQQCRNTVWVKVQQLALKLLAQLPVAHLHLAATGHKPNSKLDVYSHFASK